MLKLNRAGSEPRPGTSPRPHRRAVGFGLACALSVLLTSVVDLHAEAQRSRRPPRRGDGPSAKSKVDPATVAMQQRVVLVYPPDLPEALQKEAKDTPIGPELSSIIFDVEKSRLESSASYRAVAFNKSLPPIRRAILENAIKGDVAAAPFDQDTKIRKFAQLTGYDLALVTTVLDYTYDATKKQVSMVLSARLVDLSGVRPVTRSNSINGSSPDNPPPGSTESSLAQETARSLAERLMSTILGPRTSTN